MCAFPAPLQHPSMFTNREGARYNRGDLEWFLEENFEGWVPTHKYTHKQGKANDN